MEQEIRQLLLRYWGYGEFRPMQAEIITSVLEGHDTLGMLPTGGGKSITFQLPAVALDGLTLVITPLISLMKDQVDALRQRGIPALYLHSGLSYREQRLALDRVRLGKVKLLYLSPEKLQGKNFIEHLRLMDVRLIVVDEAHCISQGGYDFRPSYLRIKAVRELFPKVNLLALTASAPPEVADDIMRELGLRSGKLFPSSFARENISYLVRYSDSKESLLVKILESVPGSAIVYARSRRKVRELAGMLAGRGISADFYHAGLEAEEKELRQNRWKEDACRVMVATNAFGMGIDKPDVRLVIHHDIPSSLEEYYQEAGRAGRDGRPSYAVLVAGNADKGVLTRRISEGFPEKEFIRRVYELLGNFLDVAVGSGYDRSYEFNLNLFSKRFDLPAVPVHNALKLLTKAGYIDFMEEISTGSRLMVLLKKEELYSLRLEPSADKLLQTLLRTYTGLFADYVFISEKTLASRLGWSEQKVYEELTALSKMRALHYVPRKSTPYILYTTSRELPKYVDLPSAVYEEQRQRLEHRIEAVKRYAFSRDRCRVGMMLRYFGEDYRGNCGKCDYCRGGNSTCSGADA